MKAVYIAGPMRGIPEFNFPAFFAAERDLQADDVVVFNPARRDVENHGADLVTGTTGKLEEIPQFSLRDALGCDLAWICQNADEIYMLEGWGRSQGAIAERATALALGLDVTYQGLAGFERTANEENAYGQGLAEIEGNYAEGWDEGYDQGYQDREDEE